jgi:hypothetical protein
MEAFLTLKEHTYLASASALTAATVFIIAAAYGHIIGFLHGSGGYYRSHEAPRHDGRTFGSAHHRLRADHHRSTPRPGTRYSASSRPAGTRKMGFEIACYSR